MAALKEILPPSKSSATIFYDHSSDPWFKQRYYVEKADVTTNNPLSLYNTLERSEYLPVTVDDHGNLTFDAIVKHNENARMIVFSHHSDLIPKILKDDEKEEPEDDDEKQQEIEKTAQQTKALFNVMLSAAQPKNVQTRSQDSKFLKYKPSQRLAAFTSGEMERIIRLVEMPIDPLEPPKFKHKRIPKAYGLPPVPVMQSLPRPLTVEDQKEWKIPPCVSNWKNAKGYTIPLDKRLAADGRGLQEVQINDHFAQLSEALYVAEQRAREAVSMRSKVQKEMKMKEKQRKEQELRMLAQKARFESTGSFLHDVGMMDADEPMRPDHEQRNKQRDWDPPIETKEEREERIQREEIREGRRRERERERRLEAKDTAMGKKCKITRDRDRDISEKVALGMAAACGGEVMYDQRLFNQEKGMDSGFASDDQYNVYDTGLFIAQPTLSTLYRPKKDADDELYDGQCKKIRKTDRFKPDKEFTGVSDQKGGSRAEFEREIAENVDPFGLDQFITQVNGGKKPLDKFRVPGP